MVNKKSIAIMGGTFDPIHFGHLAAAEAVRYFLGIDKILFVPTGNPYYKQKSGVTDKEIRYEMVSLAIKSNPYFEVSRIELDREGNTYTVDTLNALNELYNGEVKIYFIMGADSLNKIIYWKNVEEIFKLCEVVAVTRPGFNKDKLKVNINEMRKKFNAKVHFVEIPGLDISSTEIRERVKRGMPIKYLLPECIENYIINQKLYLD